MTWASHIIIGSATAKTFGLNYILTTFGSILPDIAEMVVPQKVHHRGITHSVSLWLITLVLLWGTPVRDALIGVAVGHLFMDSLTVKGVPVFDQNSRHITILGGKIRTGSTGEFVISGFIAFLAFVILSHVSIETTKRNWEKIHQEGIIDRKEYYENRFKFF